MATNPIEILLIAFAILVISLVSAASIWFLTH